MGKTIYIIIIIFLLWLLAIEKGYIKEGPIDKFCDFTDAKYVCKETTINSDDLIVNTLGLNLNKTNISIIGQNFTEEVKK